MTTTVQDAPERSRFEIEVDGELAGFLDYRKDGDEYALPHTRVYPQFEGHGLGSQLVRGALEEIAERGGTVLPYCPFVPKVIRDNPELTELVREEERAGFDL
ncbi:GNAT family N-acetyltransferase [Aeromicrobium panaciterrae]|uniref:GNAT family N-acetyltransferase n=1 Tax=Aeromicrobium panaciterrae TaxID=363861 RepID=UPI0031E2624E